MSSAKGPFWQRKTFLVITGASQGIGKNLAVEFSRKVTSESALLLVARSLPNLEGTKKAVLSVNPSLNVKVLSVDLSKPDARHFERILSSCLVANGNYELYFLVHNAASVECHVPVSEMNDLTFWNEYMTLNLYSVSLLTSAFLKLFKENERCILNMTSLAAIQPMKGMAPYCIGKASREMYFRMLAEEDPSLTVFNYAPGPVDTDMFRSVASNCVVSETRNAFEKALEEKRTVKMEDTVAKLVDILDKRSFINAGRIDYFDL